MSREPAAALVLVAVGSFCAVKVVNTYSGLGSLLIPLLVGLVVVAAAVRVVRAGVTGHAHGSDQALIARHEAGHAVAARELGRLDSARVWRGGGEVEWTSPASMSDAEAVEANVAFLLAGKYAGRSRAGCSADRAAIRRQLRRVPDPGAVRARADATARRIVSSRQGEIDRVAAALLDGRRL